MASGIKYLSKAGGKELRGTVLLRLDFNTEDEWRMEAALPTVRLLLKYSGKVVIMSHRGRPEGFDKKLSLKKDAVALGKMLGRKVVFLPDFDFSSLKKKIKEAPDKSVFMLENVRFLKGETENGAETARRLASLGDFYVNDAFAVSYRENASIVAITKFLPSFAGLGLEKEIKFLSHVMAKPKKPLVVLLGGAKAHDKLGVLKYFRKKADLFLVGGATADTLLSLGGVDVGKSLVDTDKEDLKALKPILDYSNIVLPEDLRSKNGVILDIGTRTAAIFSEKLKKAGTVLWSGPMGAFEKKEFEKGTVAVAKAIASNRKAFSVTGGGETVTFLKKHKLDKKFSFISTGGGAMLDFLAGEKLVGIEALKRK